MQRCQQLVRCCGRRPRRQVLLKQVLVFLPYTLYFSSFSYSISLLSFAFVLICPLRYCFLYLFKFWTLSCAVETLFFGVKFYCIAGKNFWCVMPVRLLRTFLKGRHKKHPISIFWYIAITIAIKRWNLICSLHINFNV